MRAVVNPFDLAELQRVEHEADVSMPGEPDAVMLVVDLVAEADAVFLHRTMPAQVQDGRHGLVDLLREIEVGGDIQSGPRLEMQLFDKKVGGFDACRLRPA